MNCHMECQDYTKCYRTTPHMQGHLSHLTSFSPPVLSNRETCLRFARWELNPSTYRLGQVLVVS